MTTTDAIILAALLAAAFLAAAAFARLKANARASEREANPDQPPADFVDLLIDKRAAKRNQRR